MKKLLFLTHYFPPEINAPANRTYEHCKEWVKSIEITVVTNVPNHPTGKIFHGYKNKLIQKETIDGIEVVRVATFLTANEGFLLRTLNYIFFMVMAICYATFSREKYDKVVATSPQFFCGLAGTIIGKVKRIPFILEIRDLWPESIVAVGALKNKKIIGLLERLEFWMYSSAEKIVSVTKSFKEIIERGGIAPEKISVVYNGISFETFNERNEISNIQLKEYCSDGFIVGYIGTIGMAHSIKTLVDAAERMKDSDVKFIVVGSGAEKEKLELLITEKKLKNIKIFGNQAREEIPSIILKLDLFCVHLKKADLFKTVIPSKVFEGMVMKKPVLLGVEGETQSIVADANCGLFFEPENVQDLVNKILVYKNNEELRTLHGENGYSFVRDHFNRKVLANKMLQIIFPDIE